MDIHEARRQVLLALIKQRFGGSQKKFGEAVALTRGYVSRMVSEPDSPHHKNIGDEKAADLEAKLGLPSGTFLNPQVPGRAETPYIAGQVHERVAPYTVETAADLVERLGRMLVAVDQPVRQGVYGVLSGLVERPESAKRLGQLVQSLLDAGKEGGRVGPKARIYVFPSRSGQQQDAERSAWTDSRPAEL